MGGSNPNAGGQRRMCGPFLVAGAALHGPVILERVETECWGVNAECVVHASWQAQHCSRCPLVFCCVYRSLAKTWLDISCICDWRGIVEGLETERGGVKTEGVFLCLCHLQRNGLILYLLCIRDRRSIVERVEAECGRVNAECVVHFWW